jgi:cation diffusion facilitator family transporter
MHLKNDKQSQEDFKLAERTAIFGVIGNVILTLIKLMAGIVGNSSAMIADALHSASDIFASAVVFVSLKIAKKPADKEHPYGHGKAEAIATSIVGIMLFVAGLQIMYTGIKTIKGGSIEAPGIIALYAAIFSIVCKEAMYRVTYKVGKKINSPSTIANAMDHRSDAFSSVATFIGIGGAIIGFPILDPIAGIVVSLFILKMSIDILKDGIRQIMDSSIEDEKISSIRENVLSVDGVKDTHGIRVRQSGPNYIVDLDICVDKDIPLHEAHEIGDAVRSKIYKSVDKIYEVRVHVDPMK